MCAYIRTFPRIAIKFKFPVNQFLLMGQILTVIMSLFLCSSLTSTISPAFVQMETTWQQQPKWQTDGVFLSMHTAFRRIPSRSYWNVFLYLQSNIVDFIYICVSPYAACVCRSLSTFCTKVFLYVVETPEREHVKIIVTVRIKKIGTE